MADPLRLLLAAVAAFVWLLTAVFSTWYFLDVPHRGRYRLFSLLAYTGSLGVFLAGDLLTLFVFFEIMSVCTFPLVLHDESEKAIEAATLYLTMAVAGGLSLLMGLFLLFDVTKTFDVALIAPLLATAPQSVRLWIAALFTAGFGVKAGMVPLHIWLPKAHPAAPAPASALLSGVMLKTGIFGLLLTVTTLLPNEEALFWGLLAAGAATMALGSVFALFRQNVKEILAYSSLSQMGLLLMGIAAAGILGAQGADAAEGVVLHAVNHMVFKVLLFLSAGVLIHQTHKLNLSELQGAGRNQPLLKAVFIIGALGIAGVPGFSGYTGKTLLHHAFAQTAQLYHNLLTISVEAVVLLGSACTAAYMLKLVSTLFFMHPAVDEGEEARKLKRIKATGGRMARPLTMLSLAALPVLAVGLLPNTAQAAAANAAQTLGFHGHAQAFFSLANIVAGLPPVVLGITLFWLMQRRLAPAAVLQAWHGQPPAAPAHHQTGEQTPPKRGFGLEENIYKPVGRLFAKVLFFLFEAADNLLDSAPQNLNQTANILAKRIHSPALRKLFSDTTDAASEGGIFSGVNAALYTFGTMLVAVLFLVMF
jgi:formate hydrogenlyase subunit 3/multisubunit Na+/H+ antiporter MnhD subunit